MSLYSTFLRPCLECFIKFWAPSTSKMLIDWREFSGGLPKKIRRLECLLVEEKLRELGLFSLEELFCLWGLHGGPNKSPPVPMRKFLRR